MPCSLVLLYSHSRPDSKWKQLIYIYMDMYKKQGKPPGNIFYSVLLECNICIWFTIKSFNFTRGVLFGSGEWSWWIRPGSPNFLLCIPQCVKVHLKNYIHVVLYWCLLSNTWHTMKWLNIWFTCCHKCGSSKTYFMTISFEHNTKVCFIIISLLPIIFILKIFNIWKHSFLLKIFKRFQ